jgi:hypothetical protein
MNQSIASTFVTTFLMITMVGCAEHVPPGLHTQIVRTDRCHITRDSGKLMTTIFTPADALPNRPMVVAMHGGRSEEAIAARWTASPSSWRDRVSSPRRSITGSPPRIRSRPPSDS